MHSTLPACGEQTKGAALRAVPCNRVHFTFSMSPGFQLLLKAASVGPKSRIPWRASCLFPTLSVRRMTPGRAACREARYGKWVSSYTPGPRRANSTTTG